MARPADAAVFAYVTNVRDNTVSVIDTATHPPVATITVGNTPVGVAVTPNGKHAWVTNEGSNSVSVIRTATNMVVATIPVGNFPTTVAFTPDGTLAYVTNFGSHNVSVIDTATKIVVATVTLPVKDGPQGIAITPDGKHAYVANNATPKVSNVSVRFSPPNNSNVSVIDTASNTIVATVPVPMGRVPLGSPSPRMGNMPMLRLTAH